MASGSTFRNAAVDADVASMPMEYVVNWLRFDNATGAATHIGTTRSEGSRTSVPVPLDLPSADGVYITAELAASGGPASWSVPVHAYFFREHANWKLVGFERVPDGNAPNSAAPRITDARSPAGQPRSTFEARIADAVERNRRFAAADRSLTNPATQPPASTDSTRAFPPSALLSVGEVNPSLAIAASRPWSSHWTLVSRIPSSNSSARSHLVSWQLEINE